MLKRILILIIVSSPTLAFGDLDISSLNLKLNRQEKKAVFQGEVFLCFNSIKLLTSKVVFEFTTKDNKKIAKIVMPDKIRAIKKEGGNARLVIANSGIYSPKSEKLSLTGEVVLQDKNNIIITDKMVYLGKLNEIIQK